MNAVAIIQARMGSTRLPGKILRKIGKAPLYRIIYDRVAQARQLDNVVFATTCNFVDDKFCEELNKSSIPYFRGSEVDVLSRYHGAAEFFEADFIVRVTCDDPFKDPNIIESCLEPLINGNLDFSANIIEPTFAEGLDVECFTREFLEEMHNCADKAYHREHVTQFFYENIDEYRYFSLKDDVNLSEYRLTLDDPYDLEILTELYKVFGYNYHVTYSEIKKKIQTAEFKMRLVGRLPSYAGLSVSKGV